ncbi:MAG TPA: hypothetical protein VM580_04515 [Labilithrix sp.]|nr:hypothetical protein [Labilithrix sp.]
MRKLEEKRVEEEVPRTLDVIAREGARRMIEAALEVEVGDYVPRLREHRDENVTVRTRPPCAPGHCEVECAHVETSGGMVG